MTPNGQRAEVEGRAPRPGSWRVWLDALVRLAVFGLLFVLLAGGLGGLTALAPLPIGWRVALGGTAWLLAAVLAGAVTLRWLDGRSWRVLGFAPSRRAPGELAGGVGLGAALLLLAVVPLVLVGLVGFRAEAGGLAGYLASLAGGMFVLAAPAAAEEALFRGYPFQVLARAGGAGFAVLTTSAAFAALHGSNPNVGTIALANIFVAGVLLALVYLRTDSLWAATGVHLGWNWAMAVPLDLPVSGLNWIDTPALDAVVGAPAWLTGGAFGPEGGLCATLALLVGTALLWRVPPRPACRDERPLHAGSGPLGEWGGGADGPAGAGPMAMEDHRGKGSHR